MKKHFFYPVILAGLMFGFSACSDDDKIEDDNPVDENPELVDIPTEDQMTEMCHVPVVVIGEGFSDVSEAFLRRVENLQTELTEDAKVIFFKGEDIYNFTVEQCKTIGKAYDNGAILAIDEPKEKQILDLAVKITAPEFAAGFSGEEHDVHFADLMAYNTPRGKQYILHDMFDDDPVTKGYSSGVCTGDMETGTVTTEKTDSVTESKVQEEIELTPYTLGLYADEFSKWLNNLDEPRTRTISIGNASRNTSLNEIVKAQQVTRTYSFYPNDADGFSHLNKDVKGHSVPITVDYLIHGAYSFSNDADYYLIEQEISICNSVIWRGTGDGEKGWCLTYFNYDAHIEDGRGKRLSRSEGVNVLKYSPNTTTGSQTITTTSSFSLGGNVGVSMSGTGPSFSGVISGGISWGVNHASSLPDVSVINLVMDRDQVQNNVHWTYNMQYNGTYYPHWYKKASFGATPEIAKSTFHTYNTWIWQINNPEKYASDFYLTVDDCAVIYRAERFTKNNVFKCQTKYGQAWTSYLDKFKLLPPNRRQ